jgi:signal transduction histidine kinase
VTYVHHPAKAMFVQDDTAGTYVSFPLAASRGLWPAAAIPADVAAGVEIDIEGVLDPGGFSPPVLPTSVRVLGKKQLPIPQRIDSLRFFCGADDSSLVEVVGVVQDAVASEYGWRLTIEAGGKPLLAEGSKGVIAPDLPGLINSIVRVAGPAASVFNTRGEFIMPRVYVGRRDWFEIVTPTPQEPFASPFQPIEALTGFRLHPLGERMIRTAGVVIHAEPGRAVHLQSGAGGVLVKTRDSLLLQPGDRVEVAGFVERNGPVAGLVHALLRKLSTGPAPLPIRIRPDEILAVNLRAATSSLMAQPGDYQGCLVQFPARLLEARSSAAGGGFVLGAEGTNLFAIASPDVFTQLRGLRPGSDLLVTGIARVDWEFEPSAWPPRLPKQFQLLLRSPDDVQVIRTPSWWTPTRLVILATAIGAVLAATLAWVWLLRHELAAHQTLLATEMRSRRDAALEFDATLKERNRLAANLHDTLLQTLGGIGYQLDACEGSRIQNEADARMHFDVARRMVSHAANELHQSVWVMRTLPLGQESFPDAVRSLAARLGEGHAASIIVNPSGTFTGVPDFVAGHLLLIMQEAVTNALRHGQPSTIEVTAEEHLSEQRLVLRVSDDGVGFEPAAAAGLAQGHFGVYGMRERAQRLGGSLTIASVPSRGTTVTAVVETRDYDREIGRKP